MSTKRLLHYGLQRSGTNFLKKIVQQHFDIEFINQENGRAHPTHKHFRLYDNKELIGRPNYQNDLLFRDFIDFEKQLSFEKGFDGIIVLSKDPYSWNISYSKWGKKNRWPAPPHPYLLEYNEYYRKWLQFSEESKRVILVRYVDLLSERENLLLLIQNQLGLSKRKEESGNEKTIKKVPRSSKFTKNRLKYYLKEEYLQGYNQQYLDEVNNYIDHDLIKKLGYKSYY